MVEVIPGILETEWHRVKERILVFRDLSEWVHVDVADGVFAPIATWNEPEDLLRLAGAPKIEAHLMIARPWSFIDAWLESPVARLIIHYESFFDDGANLDDVDVFIKKVKRSGKEIILGLTVETPWKAAISLISLVDGILFLAVKPGYSGQPLDGSIPAKTSSLRARFPRAVIEVDGGVKPSLVKELMGAGATRLVSTSYITSHNEPSQALAEFNKEIVSYYKESK